jgi:group I intron endonuclease
MRNKMIVYKTKNLINEKCYVGSDFNNDPRYLGSGVALKSAIKKYGKENFKKEVVAWCYAREHLNFLEKFYIIFFETKFPKGYNLTDGGDGAVGLKCSEETKKKLSRALTGHVGAMYGRHHSLETKQKISKALLDRIFTEEHRKNLSKAKGGKTRKPLSEETKNKISKSNSNPSEEIRKTRSNAATLWWKNRKDGLI